MADGPGAGLGEVASREGAPRPQGLSPLTQHSVSPTPCFLEDDPRPRMTQGSWSVLAVLMVLLPRLGHVPPSGPRMGPLHPGDHGSPVTSAASVCRGCPVNTGEGQRRGIRAQGKWPRARPGTHVGTCCIVLSALGAPGSHPTALSPWDSVQRHRERHRHVSWGRGCGVMWSALLAAPCPIPTPRRRIGKGTGPRGAQ